MAFTPSSSISDVSALEALFRRTFLESAPLYSAASKIKLPYEDLKSTVTLYHGSLHDEARTVEQIADYRTLDHKEINDIDKGIELVKELAMGAGACVDGLIRLENCKHRDGADVRDTTQLRVIDIFEHTDGRRNLNFILQTSPGPSVVDPADRIAGWIAYRFYFACARIRQKYEHSTTL